MIPVATVKASGRSQSLNAARLVNMFPEIPTEGSRSPVILRSTPGLSTFATIGTGPIRGVHVMNISNAETMFAVSGNDLYQVASDGTGTLRGAAGTIAGTGRVSMASNHNDELVIVNSSGTGWVWDGTTLASISGLDADFTDDATNVTFLDQYILYGKKNTGQVYASDLNNAKSWSALSFGTAESASDNIVEVHGFAGHAWLFGEKTVEIFYNSGATPFPFARVGGAVFTDIGLTAGTVAELDQSIYWLSSNGFVYGAGTTFQPQRISNNEIEFRLKGRTGFYAFAYKDEGHAFYVLGSDQGAEVFDASTGLWHERATYDLVRWRADNYARAYSKHLCGDYVIGRIYEMSLENYADGASPLQRRVISPPLESTKAGERVFMSEAQVHFEMGKGLTTGQGSDPQVILDYSDDGGKTWSNQRWASIGKIGEYRLRAIWRRLGSFRNRVFRFTYTEPTPFTIYGARI